MRPRRDFLHDPAPLVRRVYAYVAYRIGEGADAEDLTNDVFERALRFRSSYDPARGEPAAWLIGIARRTIADRRVLPAAADAPEAADAGDLAERAVDRVSLAAAVAQLDQRDRELIALRYGADLTASQIARLLDLRTNAVEVALHRALARLRAHLGQDDDAPETALRTVRI